MTRAAPYRGRVRIGVDAAGKPIDKYLTAPTRLELETVKQACREHFISDASRASYKSCFIKHNLPEFGLQHMTAISANDIQLFVNRFAGSSKSLITLVIGILHGIFSTAYAEEMLKKATVDLEGVFKKRAGKE